MVYFTWNTKKNLENYHKHQVRFEDAQKVFLDPNRIIYEDIAHSKPKEKRYFCVGKLGNRVCTVRFTYRRDRIRIFGAGFWRKERRLYEQKIKK